MREALMDTAMLKDGLRTCLRNPTFFALAVSSLAIGIGLTSAVFAVMHAVVFRSLPYPDPKQLLVIYDSLPGARSAENLVSPGQFADWSVKNHSFEALGAYTDAVFNVGDQDAESGRGGKVRLDLPIGVDQESDAGVRVGDEVARVSEPRVEELLDQHVATLFR